MKYLTMLALPTLLCAACQNNTIQLEFDTEPATDDGSGSDNDADATAGTADDGQDDGADTGPMPMPGIAGNWLLAAATTLDPNLPFQFFVKAEEVGPDTFNLTMTSLSLDRGSTTSPRQLVGEEHIYFGVPLAPGSGFEIFTGPITIPAAANPISGTDISVDILLSGQPNGNPFCGTISGNVTSPSLVDLSGTTFGTEKVNDIGSLPTTFAKSC